MEGNHSNEVTIVVSRKIKPGYEKEYDDWLRRYLAVESKASGYLGTTIIVQGGTNSAVRYIIHRYTDKASMREWENSQQSLKLLEEANNYSIRHYEFATGMETWFTLPDLKTIVAPPKWKMAIVVFIAAYTIQLVVKVYPQSLLRAMALIIELHHFYWDIGCRSYLFRNACLEQIAATLVIPNKRTTY